MQIGKEADKKVEMMDQNEGESKRKHAEEKKKGTTQR